VTARRDDDALTWDGDDDPTLDVGEPERPTLPDGFTAVGKDAASIGRKGDTPTVAPAAKVAAGGERAPMGNALLISLGILGGIYLLFTIGWVIGGLRLQGTARFLVSPIGYQVSLWLAVIAPLAWFATAFLLTAGRATWVRLAWLIAGAILLVPWPFIMVGAVGL